VGTADPSRHLVDFGEGGVGGGGDAGDEHGVEAGGRVVRRAASFDGAGRATERERARGLRDLVDFDEGGVGGGV
jgi:hypothetical protein